VTRGFGPSNTQIFQTTHSVATMTDLAPGSYVVNGKTTVRAATGTTFTSAWCQLRMGSSVLDTSRVGDNGGMTAATLSLQATAVVSSAANFVITCNLPPNGAFNSDTKLTAIRVGEVSSELDVVG
jgi:hypothetical protein